MQRYYFYYNKKTFSETFNYNGRDVCIISNTLEVYS